jgi:hypothetical protein
MKSTRFGFMKITTHAKASQVLTPILIAIAAVGLISGLNGCGSGAVGAPPDTTPIPSTPLAVSPPTADLFPDVPTTFTITGGKPGYSAFSSNSVVLPVTATLPGATFTVIPGPVTAETAVDITVKDAANASVSAKATVKPSTLNNQITFTPFAPTATGCGTNAICSGGDAQVVVKAAQNGVALRNRPIRFDVFQGNFQFATLGSDASATTPRLTVNTDDQGEATARVRVDKGVPTQVATLQTTDVTSGLVRRYNFNVVQQTDGKGILSVLPSGNGTITGEKGAAGQDGLCPKAGVDYYVFGGTAPYMIASPLPSFAQILAPGVVSTNGGSFTAQILGCGKTSFIVTDATGRTIETSTIEGVQGAKGDVIVAATPFDVSPKEFSIFCKTIGSSITLTGSGSFVATGGGVGFVVTPTSDTLPNLVSVYAGSGTVSPVVVTFTSNGKAIKATITVIGAGTSGCL